jgi:hypothetical protein
MGIDDVTNALRGEVGVIAAAPILFTAAVIVAALLIWRAMNWRYGGIIEGLKEERDRLRARLPEGDAADRRRAIRSKLAEFLAAGESFDDRSRTEDPDVVRPQIEAWATKVRDWLSAELDSAYAHQFTSDSGLPAIVPVGEMT